MGGRFAVGDDKDDRLRIGMPAKMPGRDQQRRAAGWCPAPTRARPRPAGPGSTAERSGRSRSPASASCRNRVATRCDSASAVCFIGSPPALLHHRVAEVDAQRDRGRRTPLGLDDLEVVDLQRRATVAAAPCRLRRSTPCGPRRSAARPRTPTAGVSRSARRQTRAMVGVVAARRTLHQREHTLAAPSPPAAAPPGASAAPRRRPGSRSPASPAHARAHAAPAGPRRPPATRAAAPALHVDVVELAPGWPCASACSRASRSASSASPRPLRRSRWGCPGPAPGRLHGPSPAAAHAGCRRSCAISEARSGSSRASLIS